MPGLPLTSDWVYTVWLGHCLSWGGWWCQSCRRQRKAGKSLLRWRSIGRGSKPNASSAVDCLAGMFCYGGSVQKGCLTIRQVEPGCSKGPVRTFPDVRLIYGYDPDDP